MGHVGKPNGQRVLTERAESAGQLGRYWVESAGRRGPRTRQKGPNMQAGWVKCSGSNGPWVLDTWAVCTGRNGRVCGSNGPGVQAEWAKSAEGTWRERKPYAQMCSRMRRGCKPNVPVMQAECPSVLAEMGRVCWPNGPRALALTGPGGQAVCAECASQMGREDKPNGPTEQARWARAHPIGRVCKPNGLRA